MSRGRGGLVALGATVVVVSSLMSSSGTVSQPVPNGPSLAAAPDAVTAVQAARRQGSQVEVLAERGENRTVYARPDGVMTAELTVMPTRVRRGALWVDIDTTLERRTGGVVAAKAADGDLTLSGGGSQLPLMRLSKNGKSLAWHWPGVLPEPVLSGNEAKYRDVLPGIDLVVLAESSGYRQHLVVKNAAAARNPALAKVDFRLAATGVTVSVDETGVLRAVDKAGEPVFTAPPPTMWDATNRTTKVGVDVAADRLTLLPDRGFLDDPATVFPVVIDPDWRTFGWSTWGTVLSGKETTPFPRTSGDGPDVAQVGQCYPKGGYCNGIKIARAYFQFDTGFLAGKTILEASFDTGVVHSPDCDGNQKQTHLLMKANNTIHDGTTWANQPYGHTASAIDAPKSNPQYHCEGFKSVGIPAADKLTPGGVTTLLLLASNEFDENAWRKYSPRKDVNGDQTRLRVKYNTPPNLPVNPRTIPDVPAPCHWCAGRSYTGEYEIRLAATLSDPDEGDMVRAAWRYTLNGANPPTWSQEGDRWTNGVEHSTNPIRLDGMEGKEFSWWVHTLDDVTGSGAVGGPRSFVVDRTAPERGPTVSSLLYKEDKFNEWRGGVGVEDTFTFDANGVGDIDRYEYDWTDEPKTSVVASDRLSGPASVRLTPPGDGPRTLYVRSVDRAGHRSATTKYRIYVRAGNGPYAQYSFEGNTTDTAFLGDRDGTLHGGATYTPGAVGTALRLDGRDGSEMTARNAVPTNTSYTFSAWVRPDALPEAPMGVVTQESTRDPKYGAPILQYRHDPGDQRGPRWTTWIPGGDPAKPGFVGVDSAVKPQLGKWTHLAAVYDRAVNELRLYVDGVPTKATVPAGAVPWPLVTDGQLVVGRLQWNGSNGHWWNGAIDEVGVYDRAMSDTEVKALVARDNVQVAHWQFEEQDGKTAKNSVTGGQHGVLNDGASFDDKGSVGRAVNLDGTTGQVTTSGPAMRTDQSFTVTAWVWANRSDKHPLMTAVSQDGVRNSGFSLQYDSANNQWFFARMSTDDESPTRDGLAATQAPRVGDWVHLAGVYDAQNNQMRIYVDGLESGTKTPSSTPWNATGPVAIGRAKLRGTSVDYWYGKVDEVRMYSRVLSPEEIRGVVAQNNVTAGAWKFDGNPLDSSSRARGGAVENGASWGAGQASVPNASDLALRLDGTDDYVHALNTVTSGAGYSVAAWVRPDKPGSPATVVSQDGRTNAGFTIAADANGRWRFFAAHADNISPPGSEVVAGSVQYGVWTHVAGVYNKQQGRLELYVNGVLIGNTGYLGGPAGAGELQIGRNKWNNQYTDYFTGSIDDVVAYNRPLFAEEVVAMAGRDLTLVHNWALDEGAGTTTVDSIGQRGGTLSGGAGYAPGKVGNAVKLDGKDDSVATTGVDVSTDQSFSISAWIWLDSAECPTGECRKDAVSIDGGGPFSKLRLGHIQNDDNAPDGKWIFEMPEPDGKVTEAAVDTMPGDVGAWVLLTGVYDAPSQMIWLYVNGGRVDDGTLKTPWKSTGGLRIGRGTANGAATAFWNGKVDDVRLYSAILDKDRVASLHQSYPADAAAPSLPVADAGHWTLDEASGTSAADRSGSGRTASLKGGAGWGGGRVGPATTLDGTTGYAETDAPVLSTNQGFSVTAWAYLTKTTGGNRVIVAQDRDKVSAFQLLYNEATGRWAASVPRSDVATPATILVDSNIPTLPNLWTHLGVVYDQGLGQLRLYVNGLLAGVEVNVSVMDSKGKFSIGRGRLNGANAAFFSGGVDDVRAFSRALSDGEIRKVHDSAITVPHGYWPFEGTPEDKSDRKNPTTLSGTSSYGPGKIGQALKLDGRSGAATTQMAGANPGDSFTVSAWAKLDRLDQDATVLAQDGARVSGFVLQYNKNVGRWVFGTPGQDADGAELVYAYSPKAPVLTTWTHLTGVYDVAGRQLRLYVDGELAGVRNGAHVPATTWGGFTIGRGKTNGVSTGFFPGAIDEVKTDLGIPTEAELRARAGLAARGGK